METGKNLTEKGKRDYTLIKRIREQGDQKAYIELFNHYHKSVYYMMQKMTNNPLEAEDLAIEAFEKAFQNLDNYITDFTFSTWLFRIAANNCIDHMRKKVRNRTEVNFENDTHQEMVSSKLVAVHHDPEENMIKKQRVDLLQNMVTKMSPKYQKVIELKYLKEYSMDEISGMLNVPVGTIKAQLFRGREELFNALVEQKEMI